jgi:hypothetical protein
MLGQHREQGGFADAGAGEDAEALAASAWREEIEGAHAEIGKYTGQDVIMPADAPYASDNCKELQFVDYSKQVGTAK